MVVLRLYAKAVILSVQYANDDLLLKTIQDNGSGYRSKAFKETHKVNSLAVYPRLHMKVVACGVSRAAHESDHLALLNLLSRCDADGRAMSVKCFKTIPMVNFDMVAVAPAPGVDAVGDGHGTGGSCQNRRSRRSGDVGSVMVIDLAGERVLPVSEVGGDGECLRQGPGQRTDG